MSGEEPKKRRLVSFADIAARQEAAGRGGAAAQRVPAEAVPERVTYADLAALSRRPADFTEPDESTPEAQPPVKGTPDKNTPGLANAKVAAATPETGIPGMATIQPNIPEAETVCRVLVPRRQIRPALTARDGHSLGEQAVYEALWENAGPHTAESRMVSAGYRTLSALCRLTVNNCKANLQSLGRKLAIEEAGSHSYTQGKTYIVYSEAAILARRRAAGLTHYIRSRGITFVDPATGVEIGAPGEGIPETNAQDSAEA